MSEERIKSSSFWLDTEAKGRVYIKLYPAIQWRWVWRFGKKTFSPIPKPSKRWWAMRYRVMVNGKWHGPKKYTFFLNSEVKKIILDNISI